LHRAKAILPAVLTWLIVVAAVLQAGQVGTRWRQQLWDETASMRFTGDIQNALNWGRFVVEQATREAGLPFERARELTWRQFFHGYVLSYERIYDRRADSGEFHLDYAPLRLLAMSVWTWRVVSDDPGSVEYRDELAAPLLTVNLWVSVVSAVLSAVLVVQWLRRSETERFWFASPRIVLGATATALTVWLNPAGMWNGHAWPQWDTWLVPFFLLAAISAAAGYWASAGASMVVGAMFKGQILFALPLLILWPVFRGNWHGAARFMLGFAATALLIGLPWLLQAPSARLYVLLSCLVALAAMLAPWKPTRYVLPIVAVLVTGALAWPIVVIAPRLIVLALGVASLVLLIGAFRWRRYVLTVLLLVFVVTTLIGAKRFDGSWSWYEIGFAYGERHYKAMHMGPTFNLPAILGRAWDWQRESIAFHTDLGFWTLGLLPREATPVMLKTLLRIIAGALVASSALALARADRCRDPRGLLAFALPFLLVFAFVPQMHERYLVWPAMVGCLALACSLSASLLLILMNAAALGQMMLTQLSHDRDLAPRLLRLLDGAHPHFGWAVVLAVLCWLYVSLVLPTQRGRPRQD
jgi:hypothetical protein